MEEDAILEQRKDQLVSFLKKDAYFSAFLIISLISLLASGLVKIGFTQLFGIFSSLTWFVLFVVSAIAAYFAYNKKYKYMFYPFIAWVVWVAVYIRTLNLPLLRDVTTGGWTLGPDLDPFLFLRWAKYIVAHGSLMAHDIMRVVPLGFETKGELIFLPYLMAWFHKIASFFGSTSVEQSAVLFPVFMFAITVIAFFLLVRKVFVKSLGESKATIVALISSFFFSIIPAFIPRTIAGIPEKESAAFFFFFIAMYFFISAWQAEKAWSRIVLALLAGLGTAGMALVWGGYAYIYVIIALAVFLAFLFGQVDFNRAYVFAIWLFTALFTVQPFSTRYPIMGLIGSPTTAVAIGTLGVIIVHLLIYNTKLQKYFEFRFLRNVPKPVVSIIVAFLLALIFGSLLFGVGFFSRITENVVEHLVTPVTDRFGVTVAENRQPFFGEWADSFGPKLGDKIPLSFWLFFIGSIFLFYNMIHSLKKKEKAIATSGYIVFLFCIIFSRYSASSTLNGTNNASLFVYVLGFIALFGVAGYYLYKYYKNAEENKLREIPMELILVFAFFFMALISARGAVRTIMVLVPPASIMIGYLAITSVDYARKIKDSTFKFLGWVLAIAVILAVVYSANSFYNGAVGTASGYAPYDYTRQWQKAMAWVRESTPQDAVFGHWWDYGYWVQTIGERATVLDGGNIIVYWDHLMGRYALTGSNNQEALDFLYAHNTTHFLIDPTDIGKYSAFSSIGSDVNYDRRSWIPAIVKDPSQTFETSNSTILIYPAGFSLDGDLIYDNNGTKLFFPGATSGVGIAQVRIERDSSGVIKQALAIYIKQGSPYALPLRYVYDNKKLIDFGYGVEAGVFIFPKVSLSGQSVQIDKDGAMLFLSNRTVKSQLARLYLYNEDNKYFKLVHTEDDSLVANIKAQNAIDSDFVFYNDFRGPIKIWEISYPEGMEVNPAFLRTSYPDESLTRV